MWVAHYDLDEFKYSYVYNYVNFREFIIHLYKFLLYVSVIKVRYSTGLHCDILYVVLLLLRRLQHPYRSRGVD